SLIPKGPESEAAIRNAPLGELAKVGATALEMNVDVFRVDTHQLVASQRFPAAPEFMGDLVFDGRWFSRVVEDSLGFRHASLAEFTLVDAKGTACPVH
ncbi:MAG: hypothetical protein ABIZ70_10995, partial [Gemmatimonadales bacterium]